MAPTIVGAIFLVFGVMIGRDAFGVTSAWVKSYQRTLQSRHSPSGWYIGRIGNRLPAVARWNIDPTRTRFIFQSVGWAVAALAAVSLVVGVLYLAGV